MKRKKAKEVYLKSLRPRALSGSYSHKLVCLHEESSGCTCKRVDRPGPTGMRKVTEEASFYIPPNSASGPYPEQILLIPQVAEAIKRGEMSEEFKLADVERVGG